jgi:hypothetical protein
MNSNTKVRRREQLHLLGTWRIWGSRAFALAASHCRRCARCRWSRLGGADRCHPELSSWPPPSHCLPQHPYHPAYFSSSIPAKICNRSQDLGPQNAIWATKIHASLSENSVVLDFLMCPSAQLKRSEMFPIILTNSGFQVEATLKNLVTVSWRASFENANLWSYVD